MDPQVTPRPFDVTHRSVLAVAVPMTLAYMTTPLLGITDTAVVGQFGDPAMIGGLAAGAIVLDLLFTTFNFLRSSTTGLVAQAVGRDDPTGEAAVLLRALLIGIVSGILMLAAAPWLVALGQAFIAGGEGVSQALGTYVSIRLFSAPAALANYAILGHVLGRGQGGLGLLLQAVLNGVNIAGSVWLGLVQGWGIEGVAWGTVIGESVAVVIGAAVVWPQIRAHLPPFDRLFQWEAFRRLMAINGDIMVRSFSLIAAFALLTRQGAQLGAVTLAANAILMNFFMVAGFVLDGFATAAEQITGRAIGARFKPAFERGVWLTLVWGFALAALMSLLCLLAGGPLIAFMTTAENVRAEATQYLPWAALTPLTGVLAFQMDGVYIGATWSRDMRNMMLLSLAGFIIVLVMMVPVFANHGLWFALHAFLVMRGISLWLRLPRQKALAFS